MIKRITTGFIVLAFSVSVVLAGAVVSEFRGEPGRNKVTLKWTSEAEINLKGYEIQRGLDEKNLEKIDFVDAKGQTIGKTEYEFIDNSVFKTNGRIYYYRIKIVSKDESFSFSKTINVNPTISSARATWGSIKAMFR